MILEVSVLNNYFQQNYYYKVKNNTSILLTELKYIDIIRLLTNNGYYVKKLTRMTYDGAYNIERSKENYYKYEDLRKLYEDYK